MYVCSKNSHCIGCNYEYADTLNDIDEEFRECEHLEEIDIVKYSRWVPSRHKHGFVVCEKCKDEMSEHWELDFWRFCNTCGARMKG